MKLPSQVQFTAAESAPSVSAGRFNRFEVSKAKCRSFSCWQLVAMKWTLTHTFEDQILKGRAIQIRLRTLRLRHSPILQASSMKDSAVHLLTFGSPVRA